MVTKAMQDSVDEHSDTNHLYHILILAKLVIFSYIAVLSVAGQSVFIGTHQVFQCSIVIRK